MNRHNHLNLNSPKTPIPKQCFVGESSKNIYSTKEEAEVAAKVAEYNHGIKLGVYKCDYGNHWHLTSK